MRRHRLLSYVFVVLASVRGAPAIAQIGPGSGGLSLNAPDQLQSGGANIVPFNIGTVASGTTTVDCGKNPGQYMTNGGAFTLAAPAIDGLCMILVTNNASAGAITFSGFTAEASHGDALTTTNGSKFTIQIWRINGTADYRVAAMQ